MKKTIMFIKDIEQTKKSDLNDLLKIKNIKDEFIISLYRIFSNNLNYEYIINDFISDELSKNQIKYIKEVILNKPFYE